MPAITLGKHRMKRDSKIIFGIHRLVETKRKKMRSSEQQTPRLPDGVFANRKFRFWYDLEGLRIYLKGLRMDTFGIFRDLLVFYNWPFGIFH
jgi:hypothetical protein